MDEHELSDIIKAGFNELPERWQIYLHCRALNREWDAGDYANTEARINGILRAITKQKTV